MSSASALQTPGGLGLCGSENPLPGAWAEAPSSPQPRAPPRPSSSVRIISAVGQAQPQQVTPQTAGEGDVVFELSLRRKRKHRDNKERKWPGPAHPVSLVRPPPSAPLHRPPQRQPTTQAGSCASRGLRSGTLEVWDTQGGGPTEHVPMGARRRAQAWGRGCRKRSVSLGESAAHPGRWPGSGGPSCLLSTFHPWAVGASRWAETRRERKELS